MRGKVSAANVGTAVHAALEYHFKGLSWKDGASSVYAEWGDEAKQNTVNEMVVHFLANEHNMIFANWTPVEIEERMTVEWGTVGDYTVFITGEPDIIFSDEFGDLHMVDWKTVNNVSNVTGMPYKRQAYTYDWLLHKSSGRRLSSFVFAILHREKITNPIRYDWVTFTDELRTNYALSLESMIRDIVQVYDDNTHAYPNPTKDCAWMCPYFKVCATLDSDKQKAVDILEREFRHNDQEVIGK